MNDITLKILRFLDDIGLSYRLCPVGEKPTFLPGLQLYGGELLIDMTQLKWPGDILHEAGHLACMPANVRKEMSDQLDSSDLHQGGEMMAIAWSYAACIHLEIDPYVVFHKEGYKGGGKEIVEGFQRGDYFGVSLMQWYGMCKLDKKNSVDSTQYPQMINWLCKNDPHSP